MQFSSLLVAAAAFVGAQALVIFTDPAGSFPEITAGKSFNFTWADAVGPVTLTLENGGANNLQDVSVIASGLTGTSYLWNVPLTLPADTYAVKISDGTTTNYSEQFQLIGGASKTSSGAASTTSGTGFASTASTGSSASTTASATSGVNGTASSNSSSASKTSSKASSTGSKTSSATGSSSTTSAPSSASGLSSPLAFVLLALAAFFTLN